MPPRPRPPDARKFAAIAAECARVCGLDVRLTPLDEVRITVTAPGPPAPPEEVSCVGVRFDEEYVIVRLPGGRFRALKADGSGRVVQRLDTRGGFRIHVSRVFGSLVWDRLKRGRSRYEPQLELLAAEGVVDLSAELSQLEPPGPKLSSVPVPSPPSPVKAESPPPVAAPGPPSGPGSEPARWPAAAAPPRRSAPEAVGPPGPSPAGQVSASAPAPPPGPPSPPGPRAPGQEPPASFPPPASGGRAPSPDPGAPLARRLRGSRTK